MNPMLKKALSAVAAAIAGAALVALQKQFVPLAPEAMQATLVALLAGLSHYLDAWGHEERVVEKIAQVIGIEKP